MLSRIKTLPVKGYIIVGSICALISVYALAFERLDQPVNLLHLGSLSSQIQAREVERLYGESDLPVHHNSPVHNTEQAHQLVQHSTHAFRALNAKAVPVVDNPLHDPNELSLMDHAKEEQAQLGAENILNAYGSILSDTPVSHSAPYAADRFVPRQDSQVQVAQAHSENDSIMKAVPRKSKIHVEEVPDFVQRAREEVAHADYIRFHDEHHPHYAPEIDYETSSSSRHRNQAKKSKEKNVIEAASAAASIPRAPSGSSIQSIVDQAVQKALSAQGHKKKNEESPEDLLRLSRYLSKAQEARVKLDSSQGQASQNALRREQVAVLAKRVEEAQNLLSHIVQTKSDGSISDSASNEYDTQAKDSRTPYSAMAREGLISSDGDSDRRSRLRSRATTMRSEEEGLSAFSAEEQHLKSQIDSIFGPPSSDEHHGSEPMRRFAEARPRSLDYSPAVERPRHQQLQALTSAESATVRKPRNHYAPNSERESSQNGEVSALKGQMEAIMRKGAEKLKLLQLKDEVKRMKEEAQLMDLRKELHQMQEKLQLRHLRRQVIQEQQLLQQRRLRQQSLEEKTDAPAAPAPESAAAPALPMVRVCDPLGCRNQTVAPPEPVKQAPPEFVPPANRSAVKGWVEKTLDRGDIWQDMLPWSSWPEAWESEVHLDANGTIKAAHDDPHGHLQAHNDYQEDAIYPDGRHPGQARPGISNTVGEHLFDDNIVAAAPGFNAGTGRHVRAQQAVDWQRNWGSSTGKLHVKGG